MWFYVIVGGLAIVAALLWYDMPAIVAALMTAATSAAWRAVLAVAPMLFKRKSPEAEARDAQDIRQNNRPGPDWRGR